MEQNELYLIYVRTVGKNSSEQYEYEFFFSDTLEFKIDDEWYNECPLYCTELTPDENTYSQIKRLVTEVPFFCAQKNTCFSMKKCTDGIIALCFEDISNYENFPEPYRMVFQFGETYESVLEKLSGRDIYFNE